MSSNEQYPARVEQFHAVSVTIYEIDGKDYLTGEDIGRCLGLTLPRKSVTKIYQRNREELEPHKAGVNLGPPSGNQEVMVFTETGANLIGMFSRTAKSKDFRLWLAKLPRRVREAAPLASRRLLAEGVKRGFTIASDLMAGKMDPDDLVSLWWWRRHQATQKEVAALLDLSRDQVQVMEKRLKELGLDFPEVRGGRRRRQMKDAFAAEIAGLGGQQIPSPSPQPSPARGEGVKELGHGTAAG